MIVIRKSGSAYQRWSIFVQLANGVIQVGLAVLLYSLLIILFDAVIHRNMLEILGDTTLLIYGLINVSILISHVVVSQSINRELNRFRVYPYFYKNRAKSA